MRLEKIFASTSRPKIRHMMIYGAMLAALTGLLDWMDFRHSMHRWSTEFYLLCVAILFAALGAWLANRLAPSPRGVAFQVNTAAIAELGLSTRELEVLAKLAAGASNKTIARQLDISPNTVKTHIARLFEKLEVSSRAEAIVSARRLALLP